MNKTIVLLCAFSQVIAWGAPKTVVCKACRDTGKVLANCPVCRGSKYVWRCQPKGESGGKGWATYEVLSNDADGIRTTEGWCGWGATYKALHRQCPNVRKRQGCPNCAVEGKSVGSGKVRMSCADCDGHGHLLEKKVMPPQKVVKKDPPPASAVENPLSPTPPPSPPAPEPASATRATSPAAAPAPQPLSEEVRKLVEIEEAHDREMRQRKFGKE